MRGHSARPSEHGPSSGNWPGSLSSDMRGQSGPCKDWIGQSIEGIRKCGDQTPEGCTIAPHSSRICRLATVLRGGTTYFRRSRNKRRYC